MYSSRIQLPQVFVLSLIAYNVPAGAETKVEQVAPREVVYVTKGSELQSALNAREMKQIILMDGVYDSDMVFQNGCRHHIKAENPGMVLLKAGMSLGGRDCPKASSAQGLRFDVTDKAKLLNGNVVTVWGSAEGTSLIDIEIRGNNIAENGIVIRQPIGAKLSNIYAENFLSNGIVVQSKKRFGFRDPQHISDPVVLENIHVRHVSRPVPLSSDGSAEACIWAGEKITAKNLLLEECAWMGLWTGSATNGSTYSGVVVRNSPQGTGLYLGHFTMNSTFRDVHVGPSVKVGIKCEWGSPPWGGVAGCHDVLIESVFLETTCVGIWLDAGTTRTTVRGAVVSGQQAFAAGDFRGVGNVIDFKTQDQSGVSQPPDVFTGSPSRAVAAACN